MEDLLNAKEIIAEFIFVTDVYIGILLEKRRYFMDETEINDILANDVAIHKTNILSVLNESTLLQHFLNMMLVLELRSRLVNSKDPETLLNQWITSWQISIDQLAVDMDLLPDVKDHLFDVSKKTAILIKNLLMGE
ncbi:MAG: hypothetical protein Q8P20_01055 [bacterium]|nr:hypothetical protein [bacterium]